MKFKNQLAYVIRNTNVYNLSKFEAEDITKEDFTFCATVKVDWKRMKEESHTNNGGIICKAGMHLGLIVNKTGDNKYLKAMAWVHDEGQHKPVEILMQIHDDEEILNLGYIHDLNTKTIVLYKNGEIGTVTYSGRLVDDYDISWIWIGCSNAFEPCEPVHRNFFNGDIYFLGVFKSALPFDVVEELFDNQKLNDPIKYKTIVYTDLKQKNHHKIKDISGSGNHLIKYSKKYFD
jgi:hypothetical protein